MKANGRTADSMLEPNEFRRIMGHFPSGVTIVTSRLPDGRPCGLTVNAFCSVSLIPPLILICVETSAESRECIEARGTFVVNVLRAEDGESLSRRFSEPCLPDRFDGIAYRWAGIGDPVLEDALAWMECRVTQTAQAGDHTIFIAEVIEADAREGHPLVYYRGGYGRFDT